MQPSVHASEVHENLGITLKRCGGQRFEGFFCFFWLRFFSHDLDRTRRIIYIIYHNMYCMSAFCNCHCILIFTQSLGWILQLLINWWFAEHWRPHNGFTRRMFNRGDSFQHYYKCPISSGNWLMIPNYANELCLIFVHHGIHGHHYENVYLYTILYIIIYICIHIIHNIYKCVYI